MERKLRKKLKAYLNGEISLQQLSSFVYTDCFEENFDLLNSTKLVLAEYSNGHWTKPELYEKLFEISSRFSLGQQITESLKQFTVDLKNDDKHVWRLPHLNESREIQGVCIKCGAHRNKESLFPCIKEF